MLIGSLNPKLLYPPHDLKKPTLKQSPFGKIGFRILFCGIYENWFLVFILSCLIELSVYCFII